jgi:hypothetical protein
MTPAWILDIFAAIMLIVAGISGARLVAPWRRDPQFDVDAAHLLMGVSMAGMLVASLRFSPSTVWEVIFGALTAWFAWRVVRDARTAGIRALAGGHCAPHLVHSAAMLYMYLALVTTAGTGSGMSGMGGQGTQSLSYPTLAFVFGVILAGYSVWDLDQLSGRRYSLAGATTAVAAPAFAGVPAGPAATVISGAGAVSGDPVGAAPSPRAKSGKAVARELLFSPGMAVSCRVAMGVTMALMLIILI